VIKEKKMNISYLRGRVFATAFFLAVLVGSSAAVVGQIAAGNEVSVDTQRALGLVTINGGCSGTLLNQFWVLTARHCVTVRTASGGIALSPANQVQVTATWSAKTGLGERIRDFAINSAAGSKQDRDIVLVYLGNTNLGEVGTQKIFAVYRDGKISARLRETDTVTQYGIGFSTFATDLMNPSSGMGIFRSGVFNPSNISATHYDLVKKNNQSGHGHDSGGPSVVTVYGQAAGIAGVQSTCEAMGHVSGAPVKDWLWATGINRCSYVSTEPFLTEIAAAIKEAPLKAPFIKASRVVYPSPYHPALVILEWDGGPAHPNAEVFVSLNGSPDTPAVRMNLGTDGGVFKQPKISGVEMKLARNTGTYRFLLKAGGLTLAVTDFIYVQ
jgi:hypothetical protein